MNLARSSSLTGALLIALCAGCANTSDGSDEASTSHPHASSADKLANATVWKACSGPSAQVHGKSPLVYRFVLNTQQNSGTLTVQPHKGSKTIWGPYQMSYNGPGKWQFIPGGGITIAKFEITGNPTNGFSLLHNVNSTSRANPNHVDFTYNAQLRCQVAELSEI